MYCPGYCRRTGNFIDGRTYFSLRPYFDHENRRTNPKIEKDYTIILVTHNMQQAARVSDVTGFFLNGELIEHDLTENIFTKPKDQRTEDYITGRFG